MQLPYPQPDLADAVVRLRPWEHRDLDCVQLAATDPRIPQRTSVPPIFSPGEGIAFIERQWGRQADSEGVSLAIEDATAAEAVGLIVALFRPQPAVVGLGYWVVPNQRGQGHAGLAVALLAPWLLNETPTAQVEALVEPGNLASRRCLEQNGFVEEGCLRSYLEGKYDVIMYSLLTADLAK